jgi:hypothetical protein
MQFAGIFLILVTIVLNIYFDAIAYRYISMLMGILGIYALLRSGKNREKQIKTRPNKSLK